MRDVAPAIAASIAIHLLVIGLIGFTWSSEPELHRTPKIPPHVMATVLEKEKPAVKPAPKPAPKPKPKPAPKPAAKPVPKPAPVTKPAEKPAPPKPAEKPKPTFRQPSMAELLAQEELELEQQEEVVAAEQDTGPSEAEQAEITSYTQAIRAAIESRWILPNILREKEGVTVELRIRTLPGGEVLDVSVIKPSGYPVLDDAALSAVRKASPLPVPSGATYQEFRVFTMRMIPKFARSE